MIAASLRAEKIRLYPDESGDKSLDAAGRYFDPRDSHYRVNLGAGVRAYIRRDHSSQPAWSTTLEVFAPAMEDAGPDGWVSVPGGPPRAAFEDFLRAHVHELRVWLGNSLGRHATMDDAAAVVRRSAALFADACTPAFMHGSYSQRELLRHVQACASWLEEMHRRGYIENAGIPGEAVEVLASAAAEVA